MPIYADNVEAHADRRADRRTFLIIMAFLVGSWIVLSVTQQNPTGEFSKNNWMSSWVSEGASHFAMVFSILLVPLFMSRVPFSRPDKVQTIALYGLGFLVFSGLHILLMTLFRTVLFPPLFDEIYRAELGQASVWGYEMSKDVYTYALALVSFHFGRHMEQLKMEVEAMKKDAKINHRLSLKSGGRTIYLNADEVVRARAASNYVEIHTPERMHLARMTLSRLNGLLLESGNDHIRVHRSHLVKRSAIRELVPAGDGDARLVLKNGDAVPVSRSYRGQTEAHMLA